MNECNIGGTHRKFKTVQLNLNAHAVLNHQYILLEALTFPSHARPKSTTGISPCLGMWGSAFTILFQRLLKENEGAKSSDTPKDDGRAELSKYFKRRNLHLRK